MSPMVCIRCSGELHHHGSRWHCQPGCEPSVPGYHLDDETHNCDQCGKRVASRGLLGTPEGVYCSAACIGRQVLESTGRQQRCPVCDDGPTSDRYKGTCSPVCEGELQRIASEMREPSEVAREVLGGEKISREWSHRIVRGGGS